jgi:hypothetical protein
MMACWLVSYSRRTENEYTRRAYMNPGVQPCISTCMIYCPILPVELPDCGGTHLNFAPNLILFRFYMSVCNGCVHGYRKLRSWSKSLSASHTNAAVVSRKALMLIVLDQRSLDSF